ncbi:hypothetical protein MKX03_029012, partial [Papaver bracteatum]
MSKPSVDTSDGGGRDSRAYELKTKEKVLKNDWACLEERPSASQHGSPSQAHPGMSKKTFVNLVSNSDDA